jgi:lipopolysaccharide export system protein LptA
VVAIQGETMLQTPSLKIKYEGKAAAALGVAGEADGPKDGAKAKQGGTRVTFLWARDGVEITSGNDRRIASDLADFDVAAETAVFDGNVEATQEKNLLKGGRLSIDRKAGKTRLETPDGGRILASFVPPAGSVPRPKRPTSGEAVQTGIMGGFKADRSAPMAIEATLLELLEAANKAVFTGNVTARQGDMSLRTAQLTVFYAGKAGLGLTDAGAESAEAPSGKGKGREKTEIVRMEARQSVIVSSAQQSATAQWADFDVKANTALLGGGVVLDKMVVDTEDPTKKRMNVVTGDRLRLDLTTGIYQVEADPGVQPAAAGLAPKSGQAKASTQGPPGPSVSAGTPEERAKACPPGRTCILAFPGQLKKKAIDAIKKKSPELDAQ